MRVIYKYNVEVGPFVKIELPLEARVLHVAAPNPRVVNFWALIDPERESEERQFFVVGTGMALPGPEASGPIPGRELEYVGTAVAAEGQLVWHLFEAVEPPPF